MLHYKQESAFRVNSRGQIRIDAGMPAIQLMIYIFASVVCEAHKTTNRHAIVRYDGLMLSDQNKRASGYD